MTVRILFYPKQILWIGVAVLSAASSVMGALVLAIGESKPFYFIESARKVSSKQEIPMGRLCFGLSSDPPPLSLPNIKNEFRASINPARPGNQETVLTIRLESTGQTKRIALGSKIDLEFVGASLHFAKEKSPFWVEVVELKGNELILKPFAEKEGIEAFPPFSILLEESPLKQASDFFANMAFKFLADSHWLGSDLFQEGVCPAQRLEIHTHPFDLKLTDWLVFKEGKWEKQQTPSLDHPVARVKEVLGKKLILEGWDGEDYLKIAVPLAFHSPWKAKPEELFTSIRVRSGRQISCCLEKQCMVLKLGDWVLKDAGRWKILRKKEDKDAFLNGKMSGELFILDSIFQKQGQKMIRGKLYHPSRTQLVSVEIPAQSNRKKEAHKKGKVL